MIGGKQGKVSGSASDGTIFRSQPTGVWRAMSEDAQRSEDWSEGRVAAARALHGRRVLLIEDDLAMGDWLLEEFQRDGFIVALATSGREGLELIQSGLVDVVVSDMELRDMPGLDLLREIQGVTPPPRIILTTSLPSTMVTLRTIKHRASAVLCKPFGMEQLLVLMARSLEN